MDTPGYDGSGTGSRERANKAIDTALRKVELCMLVITRDLTEDDERIIQRIKEAGRELFIVFNMSDNYDMDDAEQIKQSVLTRLGKKFGLRPTFFTVSALWQSATPEERANIQQQQHRRYLDEEPVHEWRQLLTYLDSQQASVAVQEQRKRLTDIEKAYTLACALDGVYKIEAQAACMFLNYSNYHEYALSQKMPPPLGPIHLKQTREAAGSGQPLNWRILSNYKIFPADIAPRLCLTEGIGNELIQRYLTTTYTLLDTLMQQGEYKRAEEVAMAARLFIGKHEEFKSALQTLSDRIEWARWCCETSHSDFTYANTYNTLRSRWKRSSEHITADTAQIRRQLSEALSG